MATKFSETEDAEASATVLAKVNICSICGISCARKQNLRKHIESWHKTVNVDDVCPVKRAKRIDFEKESERRSTGELGSTKSAITSKANACPICGVSCATVSSVRRHIKFCHKDVNVDDVCIRKRNKKVIDLCEKVGSIASTVTVAAKRCSICDALCSTSANVCQQIQTHEHASQEHKDTNVDEVCPVKRRTRITTSSHVCVTCCKAFSRRSSLLRHIRFLHTDFDSGVFTAKKRSQVRCPVCSITLPGLSLRNMADLMKHLNETHDQNIQYEYKSFNSDHEFTEWLTRIQNETPCNYLKKSEKGSPVARYYCSRSGVSFTTKQPGEKRKRVLKVQGVSKIGRTCPAHLIACRKSNNHIEVKYASKHFCHSDRLEQLGHIRIQCADRKYLASKLAMKIPIDVTLHDIRNERVDGDLKRRHLITKKDLRNIERAFNISPLERRHENDAASVDALVRYYETKGDSPIILYKRQGVGAIDIGPDDAIANACTDQDFIFAMMDNSQCQMLKQYATGNLGVICIDSTHGTNAYDFYLTTLMVLDGHREGYPVAFLYSSRQTEETFILFFQAIRAKAGVIICPTIMSDLANGFYNAWKFVMGECNNRLFCSWHVAKCFWENITRLVKGDNTLKSHVYKQIKTLMVAQDVAKFEVAMQSILCELENNAATAEFAVFFRRHYVHCAKSWAYCFRAYCGINTNMSLERMHGILKHVYLCGRKNKRLDNAIAALLKLVRDKEFGRLIAICKGKYTLKLSQLLVRHEKSLSLDVITNVVDPGKEWVVRSENDVDEFYTVKRMQDFCSCALQCKECNACIHAYRCSCIDSATLFNMCKHIHLICRKYSSTNNCDQSERIESDNELIICDAEEQEIHRNLEAVAHISQLSQSSENECLNRESVRDMCAHVANLIETVQSKEKLMCIAESLRSIDLKLEALDACSNVQTNLVQSEEYRKEPVNKNIQHQLRFKRLTKKRREGPRYCKNPTNEESKTILNKAVQARVTVNDLRDSNTTAFIQASSATSVQSQVQLSMPKILAIPASYSCASQPLAQHNKSSSSLMQYRYILPNSVGFNTSLIRLGARRTPSVSASTFQPQGEQRQISMLHTPAVTASYATFQPLAQQHSSSLLQCRYISPNLLKSYVP